MADSEIGDVKEASDDHAPPGKDEAESEPKPKPQEASFADVDLAHEGKSLEDTKTADASNLSVKPNNVRRVSFVPERPLSAPPPPPNSNQAKPTSAPNEIPPKSKVAKIERVGMIRHIVAVLALSSIVLANMNRQAFNQALVSMTKLHNTPERTESPVDASSSVEVVTETEGAAPPSEFSSITETNPIVEHDSVASSEVEFDDRFEWTGAQIGLLQAAFSYGYTPFMIPGGRMSEIYGAKWVVFVSGFGSALCCIMSPFLADTNFYLLVASRVIMGLCQTAVSPALYALLTRWLAPDESSVYLPMIKVGVMGGFMLGSLISGLLPWRLTFYSVGVVGLLWCVLWCVMVSSDPSRHKLVSREELDYIQSEISNLNEGRESNRKAAAPWFKILTNPVVLVYIVVKFTVKLSTDAQTMQMPMYMRNVFHVSKELNGMLSSMNFAIQSVFTGLVAWIAKEFVVRGALGLSKTGVRRLFQGICNFGMGLAYVLITFNMSSLGVACAAIILLSITAMFGSGGEAILPVDLSLDYAASIMAIANSLANFSGIILPPVVSWILEDQLESSERWNQIWLLIGATMMLGGLIFCIGVKAKIQDFRGERQVQTLQLVDRSQPKL